MEQFVSLKEAASRLGLSEKTLRNQMWMGVCPLKTVKFGGRRIVPVSELERVANAAKAGKGGDLSCGGVS